MNYEFDRALRFALAKCFGDSRSQRTEIDRRPPYCGAPDARELQKIANEGRHLPDPDLDLTEIILGRFIVLRGVFLGENLRKTVNRTKRCAKVVTDG